MSEWTSIPLEKLADDITVGFVGSMTQEYVESGISFLRSKNVEPYRINLDDLCYISSEFHQKIKKSALSPGDVVIVRTGKPGSAAIIPESFPVANCSDLVIVRPSPKLDRHFLVYYLNSIGVRHINSRLVGAVQQHFNIGEARELKIHCPSVNEQQEIAAVLTCLDRKIENLRRQNETLERIAQTLFKHWFVDFEFPFNSAQGKPNADGKPYESSGGEMVRSELGEIPVGWRAGKLGDLFILNYGKSLTLEDRVPGQYPVVGSSGVGSHQTYLVSAPGIVIGRKGTIGQVIWLEDNFYPIDTTFYIEDVLECKGLYFYYFLLKRQNFQRLTSDSAVPGLNRDMAYSVEVVIPEISYIDQFNTVTKVIFNKVNLNQRQIQTLTKTRDVLLPQLMSGKLRITES